VPTTYQRLLEYKTGAGLNALPRGRLRGLYVAGAPLDPTLKAKVEQEFGLPLLNGYGITECAPAISGVRIEAPRNDTSVGTIVPGIEVRLVGRDGATAADGDVGEVHVRGPNVMLGYYRAPEATAAAVDKDGWFNTGDLARYEGGALFIAGRSEELISRSGFNVYPAEVEAVIEAVPGVAECAVIGVPHPDFGEAVVAVVTPKAGTALEAKAVQAALADELAKFKQPKKVIVAAELPRNAMGKVQKKDLREQHAKLFAA
jgi:long-chain acyl-CoA synthetase